MSLESVFKLSLIMNMIDNLSGPLGDANSKLQRAQQAFGSMAKTGVVMAGIGSQIMGAVLAPVEATFETRRAIGELASLGVQDLGAVEDAARAFSDQWAGTTKAEFISAAYDIKSGIASLSDEGVAEMTSLAALTAKATKSTAEEMTSLFATGYGIYKDYYNDLSDIEFGQMFSAGIAQSVKQFKTTGSGMAQAIQTLGASATTAQVPLEEQLSVLGMLQATMSGSEAGTKYKAFLRSAAKGGEALGLSFTDANNQLLSMPEIMDMLRGKFGETMDAAEKMELQKAFGDAEAVALIDLMYNKVGDLQDNILGMYDSLGSGVGVATEMANAINETEPERFERLQQQAHNITESIGNSLLPTVNDLMQTGGNLLTKVGAWIENNQELVRVIMLVVLAVGGFLTIAGTVIAVVSAVGLIITKTIAGFKLLKAGFLLAKGALAPLISSVWSFTASLLANPVTWIVVGIVALVAALVLLYNKCEWFRNAVNSIINFFKEKLSAALEVAKNIFGAIGNVVGKVMGAAKATIEEKLGNMKRAYEEHGGGIKGVAAAAIEGVKGIYTAGYTFIDHLTGGKLTEMKDAVGQKLNDIKATYEAHGGGIQGVAAVAMEGVKGIFSAGYGFLDNLTGDKLTEIKDTVGQKLNDIKATYEEHGVVLPGLVKSIEVTETAKIDEQEVEGSAAKPKQAVGYEDAKINIELILDDTQAQTKYQRLAMLRAVFRTPGQSVPQPIPIISEDTAAHGIDKVLFKKLSHKAENKKGQLPVTLELWEYVPQTIKAASSGSSSSGKQGAATSGKGSSSSGSSSLTEDYKKYTATKRGKSPAVDDAKN